MTTVGQLDDNILATEHRRRFHQLSLGQSIVGLDTIVHRAEAESGMTPQSRMMMLAVLLYDFYGKEPGLKADVVRKYRKEARSLGYAVESITEQGPAVRLDYDLATQVTAVAA